MNFLIENRMHRMFCLVLGGVFLWASWEKIANPQEFAKIIGNYDLLPLAMINPIALALPYIEACCGLLLLTGRLVKGSVLIVNGLLAVFIIAIIVSLFRGLDIQCGCFSVSADSRGDMIGVLVRDIFLLAIGSWTLYYRIKKDRVAL